MLSGSRMIRYLTYALGEILLVVLGILIALQVNNMNEERKSRERETTILHNLLQDFEMNKRVFENSISGLNRLIEQYYATAGLVKFSKTGYTEEQKNQITLTSFRRTEIITGTLDVLLSSENFNFIQDDSLKRMLTGYPAVVESYLRAQDLCEDYVLNYQRPIFRRYISLRDNCRSCEDVFDRKDFAASDYEGLMSTIEYQNILLGIVFMNRDLLQKLERLRERNAALIQTIQQLLEDR